MRVLLSLVAMLASSAPLWAQSARTALDRDLQGYVMASCLSHTDDAKLKDQGEAWAGAIVQRSHGDFENFAAVGHVVASELARNGVGVARRDGGGDLAVPVLTCAEMWDQPAVQQAVAAARRKLARDYRSAK